MALLHGWCIALNMGKKIDIIGIVLGVVDMALFGYAMMRMRRASKKRDSMLKEEGELDINNYIRGEFNALERALAALRNICGNQEQLRLENSLAPEGNLEKKLSGFRDYIEEKYLGDEHPLSCYDIPEKLRREYDIKLSALRAMYERIDFLRFQ